MRVLLIAVVLLLHGHADAANYFISPLGSNGNTGTTSASPWLTFAYAINPARATCGDTLILDDGTYGDGTSTGKISISSLNCTAGNELTIAAQSPRQAKIVDNGTGGAITITNSAYITIDGIYARSTDLSTSGNGWPYRASGSHHLVVRNGMYNNPNRFANRHAITMIDSADGLIEDNETYVFHRHCVSGGSSQRIVVRRQYCNPRGGRIEGGFGTYGGASPQGPPGTAGMTMTFYPCKDCILENSIADSTTNGMDLAEMNADYAQGNLLQSGSKILGSISYNSDFGNTIYINPRRQNGTNYSPQNNLVKDVAIIAHRSPSAGIRLTDSMETIPGHVTVDHMSIFGTSTAGTGILADQNSTQGALPSETKLTMQNILVTGVTGAPGNGFNINTTAYPGSQWSLNEAYSSGNGTASIPASSHANITNFSTSAHGMGTCKLWVPDGTPLKGAGTGGSDIGATILYRYVNGVLTSTPLWDPVTGAFPYGAADPDGVNRVAGQSLFDFHTRVNVNTGGCLFPSGYGDSGGGGGGGGGGSSTVVIDSTEQSGSGTTTLSWDHTISANQNLMLVCLALRDDGNNVGESEYVTLSGQPMELVRRQVTAPATRAVEIWKIENPSAGARTINVATTGAVSGMVGRSIVFDATSGLNTAVSSTGLGTTPTVTAPTNSNELVVDCVATSKDYSFSAGANQTAFPNVSHATKAILLGSTTQPGAFGGVMSDILGAGVYYAQVAVSLLATPIDPPTTAALEVSNFRVRRLLGSEVDAEYLAALDVPANIGVDGAARVRIEITGTVAATSPFGVALYCRNNADGLTPALDTFSGKAFRLYGPDAVPTIPPSLTPTTCQLGLAGCVPGAILRDHASTFVVPALSVGQRIELEWAIQLNASVGDVITCYPFKDDGTALDVLTSTPTINVVAASSQAGF